MAVYRVTVVIVTIFKGCNLLLKVEKSLAKISRLIRILLQNF